MTIPEKPHSKQTTTLGKTYVGGTLRVFRLGRLAVSSPSSLCKFSELQILQAIFVPNRRWQSPAAIFRVPEILTHSLLERLKKRTVGWRSKPFSFGRNSSPLKGSRSHCHLLPLLTVDGHSP